MMKEMKQRKIALERKQESKTPLNRLIEMLNLPAKSELPVFIDVLSQSLIKPAYKNDKEGWRKMGQRLNMPVSKVKDRLLNLEAGGYIERAVLILPRFRLRHGYTTEELAIALSRLKEELKANPSREVSSVELVELVNSICPHTKRQRDDELCSLGRWGECGGCKHAKIH